MAIALSRGSDPKGANDPPHGLFCAIGLGSQSQIDEGTDVFFACRAVEQIVPRPRGNVFNLQR